MPLKVRNQQRQNRDTSCMALKICVLFSCHAVKDQTQQRWCGGCKQQWWCGTWPFARTSWPGWLVRWFADINMVLKKETSGAVLSKKLLLSLSHACALVGTIRICHLQMSPNFPREKASPSGMLLFLILIKSKAGGRKGSRQVRKWKKPEAASSVPHWCQFQCCPKLVPPNIVT